MRFLNLVYKHEWIMIKLLKLYLIQTSKYNDLPHFIFF